MKRKDNQQNLKEVVDRLMRAYNLSDRLLQLDLMDRWEEMMGKAISKRTRELYFKEGILYIKLDSSVLREELMMGKSKMLKLLNDQLGEEKIRDIFFQ